MGIYGLWCLFGGHWHGDRFHLGVFVRIMSEVLVAIAVIELLDLRVSYLGNLFDSGF